MKIKLILFHYILFKAKECEDVNKLISSQSMKVQYKLAKFTGKFEMFKHKAIDQIQNCAQTASHDIDLSNETFRRKFQLGRSKFESIIRRKRVLAAKEKKMKRNHAEHCTERSSKSILIAADKNANDNASVDKCNSVSSYQLVKASSKTSGKEFSDQKSKSTFKTEQSSLQHMNSNVTSCNNYYAKKFCSLSIRNSAMSKSASNRLGRMLNANSNIFDDLKSMNFKKTPNYDVSKTSVVNKRDNFKRKRQDRNEAEFDSLIETKRVRFDF